MATPRVLIADKLSPAAAQIFKDRGIETDIKVGLDRDALVEIIGSMTASPCARPPR